MSGDLTGLCLYNTNFPTGSQTEEDIELAPLDQRGQERREFTAEQKKNQNWLNLRKREVLLSRVSIYIVFIFVTCHR